LNPNTKKILKKLYAKKTALFGILFIAVLAFLSFFAYLIIPDNSPNANDQHLEIILKEPMFKANFLKVKSAKQKDESSFFSFLIKGRDLPYDLIPYQTIDFDKSPIELKTYAGAIAYVKHKEVYLANKKLSKNTIQRTYYLGSDKYGRDVLSRLILGVRISLIVGLIAVFISVIIGVFLGAIGGYFGGIIDNTVMFLINTSWSIPTLLLVFANVLALGRGISIIFFAVGVTMWVDVARIVRGQVMNIKEELYVQAAKSMAFSWSRILFKHILPNTIGAILVIASSNFAMAILIEAGLSYLGFGIKPPTPSIGTMLNENYGYALSGKTYLALTPALMIMLLVLAFNLIGSGLRDVLDVKRD